MTGPEKVSEDPEFEALLDYLNGSRGFDFTGYKRPSLVRRIQKRMQMVGIEGYGQYVDYMEVHPDEFRFLFDTILINVTTFFRDPSAWELLGREMVPRILAGKDAYEPIRVWCAGCASGEEAYSLAMILAEALGVNAFRDRVKIYATDVDEEALTKARQATYDAKELEGVPAPLLEKYFEPVNQRYGFDKELRRSVIFGRHDLIQDAPISRIDLLTCRNTLMYLNTETQARILDRFHFALSDAGLLFLGKSETLLTYSNSFVPIDLRRRIFARVARGGLRDRLLSLPRISNGDPPNHLGGQARLRDAAYDSGVVAELVIDFNGLVVLANERARALFRLAASDLGRPLKDLDLSYRPADLRSCVDRAYGERRPVVLDEVEWSPEGGAPACYRVQVVPLLDHGGTLLGASVTFLDVTVARRLQKELLDANRELETATEVLQSTNEELETTNEELQSTNEELETTNEELHSTNEELETMNEELQSTNEEIETINDELRQRGEELNSLNTFLEAILGSLRDGVVVVDRELLVEIWNARAEDLWGLRAAEVLGKNFLNLDIGLPLEGLKQSVLGCLSGASPFKHLTLDATNRRGRPIRCRVTCTPMKSDETVRGVILVMEEYGNVATMSVADTEAGSGIVP